MVVSDTHVMPHDWATCLPLASIEWLINALAQQQPPAGIEPAPAAEGPEVAAAAVGLASAFRGPGVALRGGGAAGDVAALIQIAKALDRKEALLVALRGLNGDVEGGYVDATSAVVRGHYAVLLQSAGANDRLLRGGLEALRMG